MTKKSKKRDPRQYIRDFLARNNLYESYSPIAESLRRGNPFQQNKGSMTVERETVARNMAAKED
jgi:hypothetical protein